MNTNRFVRPRRVGTATSIAFLALAASLSPATGMQASTDSLSQCTSGYMCVWSGTNYTGTMQRFSTTGGYKAITLSSIQSAYNHRSARSYVHEQSDGSGVFACFNPGNRNSNLSGWLENAEAVYLSTATNC
jgi:hypothetical protein